MDLDDEYKKNRGSGSSTEVAYSVEARYAFIDPVIIAGQIFDNRWRRVIFKESSVGVPNAPAWKRHTIENGLLCYASAQALRWWLHAVGECENNGAICLETRLIEHKIESQYTITAVAQHCVVGGDDRSSCMPEWGGRIVAGENQTNASF